MCCWAASTCPPGGRVIAGVSAGSLVQAKAHGIRQASIRRPPLAARQRGQ